MSPAERDDVARLNLLMRPTPVESWWRGTYSREGAPRHLFSESVTDVDERPDGVYVKRVELLAYVEAQKAAQMVVTP